MLALLSAHLLGSVGLLGLLGPPELGGQPVPDEADGLAWLTEMSWAKGGLLIAAAIVVVILTNRAMKEKRTVRAIRPKPDFDLAIAKLASLPVTSLADAKAGPVHVEGVLRLGEGALGAGEFACVFHNRHGSGRSTAIATELALLEDDTGLLGLENLDHARVIAPREDHGPHDTISLYLGDRVQVLGELLILDTPQAVGDRSLRGMLGTLGQIQVRVLERARPSEPSPSEPSPDGSPNPSEAEST